VRTPVAHHGTAPKEAAVSHRTDIGPFVDGEPGQHMLARALGYAAAGIPVFPCISGGKIPLTGHGHHDATTDPDRIREWWSRVRQANVATPTGLIHLPDDTVGGIDVLDVDVRPDGHGWHAFHQARQAGLTDGWIRAVRTPSGGLHLHYLGTEQRNGSVRNRHIDFRATGGYVLLPGSLAQCKAYTARYHVMATSDRPGRPLDWAAVTRLLDPPVTRPHAPRAASRAPVAEFVDRLAAHVTRQSEGNRNNALYWAACRAIDHGATELQPLIEAGIAVGLDQRAAAATVRSAHRTAGRPSPHTTGRVAVGVLTR
jgi:hypothetical protein